MKNLGLFMQEHYCERMSRCFVINAPGFFGGLWRCVLSQYLRRDCWEQTFWVHHCPHWRPICKVCILKENAICDVSRARILCRALDPFVTENVKRKVSVVGSDPKAIKKLFLEELHEEVIPSCHMLTESMVLYDVAL